MVLGKFVCEVIVVVPSVVLVVVWSTVPTVASSASISVLLVAISTVTPYLTTISVAEFVGPRSDLSNVSVVSLSSVEV
jgi:hypothetical protein